MKTTPMFQVIDQISGLVHAEFSNANKAYSLWGTLQGALVQMVQRPEGTLDSCRPVEPYADADIPTYPLLDLDFDHDEPTTVSPRTASFQRRIQWRDWVATAAPA